MSESRFLQLCSILDTLLGPNGCPWDKKQTLDTLKKHVLEETCELIDALQENNSQGMKEELGDLMLNVVLFAKVAAKEGHFTLDDALDAINEKLIRRHPHIFGDAKALESAEEVLSQWEAIKKEEKGERTSVMDSIPKSLPSLEIAHKMITKMKKVGYSSETVAMSEDEEFGEKLFELVEQAQSRGIHAELALRKVCKKKEIAFRKQES